MLEDVEDDKAEDGSGGSGLRLGRFLFGPPLGPPSSCESSSAWDDCVRFLFACEPGKKKKKVELR